ncbi:MAG: hypothetical protein ACRY3E_04110 [Candidatus Lariskella arthropodorum]
MLDVLHVINRSDDKQIGTNIKRSKGGNAKEKKKPRNIDDI